MTDRLNTSKGHEEKWKEKFRDWLVNNLQFTSKSNVERIIDHVDRYFHPPAPAPSVCSEQERFKKPTDKQVVSMAILVNDGKIEQEKLTDMVTLADLIIDRLYENGDITIPSSKEK